MKTAHWVTPILGACAVAIAVALSQTAAPRPSVTELREAAPTPAVTTTATNKIRAVHSPGTVAADMDLAAAQCHTVILDQTAGIVLPDPACTPGAIDPAVTETNLATTICRAGYTATIRPPAAETGRFKKEALAAYGMQYRPTIEYDHKIPLELGGANSVSNLWPEPNTATARNVNNPKDQVENTLNRAVCEHEVSLQAAQIAINTNWSTAEHVLGLN